MKTTIRMALWGVGLSLLTGETAQAAYTPGGLGSGSLVVWLDGNDLDGSLTADGTNETGLTQSGSDWLVDQWTDKSSAGNDFTNAATARPKLMTATMNGMPIVRFDGTDDLLLSGTYSAADLSVFMVTEVTSRAVSGAVLFMIGTDLNSLSLANQKDDKLGAWRVSAGMSPGPAGFTLNTPVVAGMIKTGGEFGNADDRPDFRLTLDGTTFDITDLYTQVDDTMQLGCTIANVEFGGDIAEVLVYTSSLSSAESLIVANYLGAKWGIAMNSGRDLYAGDLAANGTNTLDVFGIAQDGGVQVTSNAVGGLILSSPTGMTTDGQGIMAGHNTPVNGMTGGQWNRVFYIDNHGGVGATLTFDYAAGGVTPPSDGDAYQLIYKSTLSGSFTAVAQSTAADGKVSFTLASGGQIYRGYYTIRAGSGTVTPLPYGDTVGGTPAGLGTNGLAVWLDANDVNGNGTSPGAGSSLTNWVDKSPALNNFTNAVPMAPTFNSVQQNNLPLVTFDGVTNQLFSKVAFPQTNVSAFMVVKWTARDSSGRATFFVLGNLINGWGLGVNNDLPAHLCSWRYLSGNGVETLPLLGMASNTATVVSGVLTGGGLLGQTTNPDPKKIFQLSANGTYGMVTNQFAASVGPIKLGAGTGTEKFGGHIGEFILYDRTLTSAEQLLLANCLGAKWGIALDSGRDLYVGDLVANGTNTLDVIGIVQDGGTQVTSNAAGGLRIDTPTGMTTDGQGIMVGHNTPVNDLTGGQWNRVWYLDNTGDLGADLTFNYAGGGVTPPSEGRSMVLRYKAAEGDTFTTVGACAPITAGSVTFSIAAGSLADGYYTVALAPPAGTVISIR